MALIAPVQRNYFAYSGRILMDFNDFTSAFQQVNADMGGRELDAET
jgi:hypothetical protein